eukprot:6146104-Amphidinium_carterae.1
MHVSVPLVQRKGVQWHASADSYAFQSQCGHGLRPGSAQKDDASRKPVGHTLLCTYTVLVVTIGRCASYRTD